MNSIEEIDRLMSENEISL